MNLKNIKIIRLGNGIVGMVTISPPNIPVHRIDDGNITIEENNEPEQGGSNINYLDHVILYGQSLALGTDPGEASVISSSVNSKHKMFNGGIRLVYDDSRISNVNSPINPDSMFNIVGLQETLSGNDYGETLSTGIGNWLTNQTLFTCTARGAYTADNLSRLGGGQQVNSNHFANTYATVLQAKLYADANNLQYRPKAIIFEQGEGDASNNSSKSEWKEDVKLIRDEMVWLFTNATGFDFSNVPFILKQIPYRHDGRTYGDISVGAAELHRESNNGIFLYNAAYHSQFTDVNDVHLDSEGYLLRGEEYGLSIKNGINPCIITGVSRTGTNIDVTVNVPNAPLVIDTNNVTEPSTGNYGFEYSGANITSVTITDDGTGDNTAIIRIVIDSAVGGNLSYAYQNGEIDLRNGPTVGPRGNFRDSSPHVRVYDSSNIYFWLASDQWSVS